MDQNRDKVKDNRFLTRFSGELRIIFALRRLEEGFAA